MQSGEYDVHSSAAMKSGVFCRRNCFVAFARCDGALSDCLALGLSKVQTVLYPIVKAILNRLTTCIFSKAENWGRFYEPPGIHQLSALPW